MRDLSVVIVTVYGHLENPLIYITILRDRSRNWAGQLLAYSQRYTAMDKKVQTFGKMVERERCFQESGPQRKLADSAYFTSSLKRKLTRARKLLP
jgi:hypothetical protein